MLYFIRGEKGMEWISKMNEAIGYIEAHIKEKPDYEAAAKIANCSLSRFQSMFTFVTDITLSEYVRNRRMALAARRLLDGGIKIIDLSAEYGYESPEAFTRAFQAFHGVPPTSVRKLGIFTDYPPFSFRLQINGGNFNMGTKPIVRIEDHSNERVVAFAANCKAPETVAGNMLREWARENLSDYAARRSFGCAPKGHHPEGGEHHPDEEEGEHEYVIYMFLYGDEGKEDTYLGANVCDAPKGLFLVSDVALNEHNSDGSVDIGSSMQSAGGVMMESLKEMGGYEFALDERLHMEEQVFSKEWWENPDITDAGLIGFKMWLPIKKTA